MKTKKPIGNARHILLAIVLLTASITGLAWLNPTIANGKISFNKIKPVVFSNLFADTIKKKPVKYHHKLATNKKPIVKPRHKGDFEYSDMDFNDPELDRLSAEVSRHGEAIGKYYESADFKKLSQEMELKGKEMGDFYNKPELKELERKQAELGEEFGKKWGQNEETTKLSARMGELGTGIGKYYQTPEFKKLNRSLEDKYGIPHDRENDWDYKDDANYQKYKDELRQNIPAEEKEHEAEMKELGKQMRGHFDSPEYHAKQAEMRAMGDSMRRAFSNPAMKEQQAEMRKLGEQMRAYQNNPQIKREKELLRAATAKMRAYMNTPEFKKRMHAWRREAMNWNFNNNFRYDFDNPEKPEKPEVPEKPEAPEKPEKPDTTDNQ